MKATITLITLATALFTQLSFGSTRIPVPFGNKEKVIHTVDLPDQKEFQMADGRYFDVGSHYEINHVLWFAFGNSEPELIGYLGNSDEYVVLTPKVLKAIKKTLNSNLEATAEVSFMDKIGGRIMLSLMTFFALYGIYYSYFIKIPEVDEEESMAY